MKNCAFKKTKLINELIVYKSYFYSVGQLITRTKRKVGSNPILLDIEKVVANSYNSADHIVLYFDTIKESDVRKFLISSGRKMKQLEKELVLVKMM